MRESLGWRWTVALAAYWRWRFAAAPSLGWGRGIMASQRPMLNMHPSPAISRLASAFATTSWAVTRFFPAIRRRWCRSFSAGSYQLFGVESLAAFIVVLSLQCLISCGRYVPVLATITLHLFGRRTATVAGLWAAIYPPFIASCLHVQAVGWNLWWLSLIVLGSLRLRSADQSTTGGWILAIGSVGAMLTDPVYVLSIGLLIVLLTYDALRSPDCWRAGRRLAIIVAAIALGADAVADAQNHPVFTARSPFRFPRYRNR